MPAHKFAAPFALWLLAVLYLAWTHEGAGASWALPPLVAIVVIYVMSPQINWWWWKKYPPVLSDGLTQLLEKNAIFYRNLPKNDQKTFRERVFLTMQSSNFMAKGFPEDEVLDDLKMIISAAATTVSFRKTDFLFPKFEQIVVYPKAFPTPELPVFHHSEMFEIDGLLIFSAEILTHSFFNPTVFFNAAIYEYARAAKKSWRIAENWPTFDAADLPNLELVSGLPFENIKHQIGLENLDISAIAAHHYFQFREKMTAIFPAKSANFELFFGVK
jgi:Glucose-regulated metallo-peptidase M90